MTMQDTTDALQILELTEIVGRSGYQEKIDCSKYQARVDISECQKTMDLSEYQQAVDICACREKMGWVSPDYTTSRSVQLDIPTALENRCIAIDNQIAEGEIYRILRSRILRHCDDGGCGKTLLVTSAVPQEGKTVTAINLAMTALAWSRAAFSDGSNSAIKMAMIATTTSNSTRVKAPARFLEVQIALPL